MLDTASSTGDGRIVFMSSKAYEFASWDPEKMNAEDEQHYDRIKVYGVTKLYNVSSVFHLEREAYLRISVPHWANHKFLYSRIIVIFILYYVFPIPKLLGSHVCKLLTFYTLYQTMSINCGTSL